jgi:integrase
LLRLSHRTPNHWAGPRQRSARDPPDGRERQVRDQVSTPKTAKGRRSIALDAATIKALRVHHAAQELARGDDYIDNDLIVATAPQTLSQAFDRLVERSGLPRIRSTIYDTRTPRSPHQAGVHPRVVSERFGHSTVAFTLDQYSHAVPAMQADAAEVVAKLVMGWTQKTVACFYRPRLRSGAS